MRNTPILLWRCCCADSGHALARYAMSIGTWPLNDDVSCLLFQMTCPVYFTVSKNDTAPRSEMTTGVVYVWVCTSDGVGVAWWSLGWWVAEWVPMIWNTASYLTVDVHWHHKRCVCVCCVCKWIIQRSSHGNNLSITNLTQLMKTPRWHIIFATHWLGYQLLPSNILQARRHVGSSCSFPSLRLLSNVVCISPDIEPICYTCAWFNMPSQDRRYLSYLTNAMDVHFVLP